MILTWLLVLVLTGWVGLATILAAIVMIPVFVWQEASTAALWFSIALAAFIVVMHWSNIMNMLNGSEYKFQRIRIVNWFR